MTLQVKPAFRHIKSDSYLDRLCGSGSNIKSTLERSESFAAVSSSGGKGYNSPRGHNQQHASGIFSPPGQPLGSLRKSDPCASKSDILSGSLALRHLEDSVPASPFCMDLSLSQGEQALKSCRETLRMVELGRDKDKSGGPSAGSSMLTSPAFTRVCKSESFCDQVDNSLPSCLARNPGDADTARTETGSLGGDISSVAPPTAVAGIVLPRLPLSLKTSLEGLDGDQGQASPHRSYTPNSCSPHGSHESGLERSLGRISHTLDGSFE